ncbi:MAG TPA: FMN-binding negative transcriptional regulator [Novosphingobium sp.]|nr:FMN-binding negative transcriptional regulator [Novosphingobium sp.]
MHPNPAFRLEDRALMEALIDEVGFGMIFASTPDGPRVAHTPLHWAGHGRVRFHLARGNGLVRHLDGATALAVVNGPDAYVSARWYADGQQVPTWNYVTLELEGRVRRMDEEGLVGLLEALTHREEARIATGSAWTMDKLSPESRRKLLAAIVGFEMTVRAWHPTFKLSQNKHEDERARIVAALESGGSHALARLMRTLVS